MKHFCLFLLLICPTFGNCQIGAKTQQQSKINGLWQNNEFGYQMTLLLNANGTGEFDGEEIKFSTQANKLAITQQNVTNNYTYVLQGNSLTLSGGDLDKAITFTRNGATSTQPSQPTSTTPATTSPTGGNLIGTWSGNGETMEFKSNGQCVYMGNTLTYSTSGNTITLQGSQGNASIQYAVNGNQLTLTVNGQNVTYTRGAASATSTASTAGQPGKGNVAQELVGKWCYMNVYSSGSGGSYSSECITLKADGTYEYYSESSRSVEAGATSSQGSDRGTWSYDGARLYYNSPTQGTGSYSLEKRNHPKNKDPMIVLNGRTFVTFFNKPQW
jgi:hypothetical protein